MPHFLHKRPPIARTRLVEVVKADVALAARLDAERERDHLDLTASIAASKRWEGTGGLELTDQVVITISANAAIPVLDHGIRLYGNVHAVIVHPTTSRSTGPRRGPAEGVFVDDPVDTVGLAAPGTGPISLAWDQVLVDSRAPTRGRNVVIHEFAHKIDMADGYSDGVPPLRGAELQRWVTAFDAEYRSIPSPGTMEPLRPYAFTNRAEFFAVATEVFFCTPDVLAAGRPRLFEALERYFRPNRAVS